MNDRSRTRARSFCNLAFALLAGFASHAQEVASAGEAVAARQLEKDFSSAGDLVIVREVKALPEDVQQRLRAFNHGFAIADLGDSWHQSGRANDVSGAISQHLFSALSDRLFFVLLNTPSTSWGTNLGTVAILGDRASEGYCVYAFGDLPARRLRLDDFQATYDRSANPTGAPIAKCMEKPTHQH